MIHYNIHVLTFDLYFHNDHDDIKTGINRCDLANIPSLNYHHRLHQDLT